jgi:ribulose-phosphate 3-epimerase
VREAEEAGAGRIQVDVMDGRFVPNITVGPLIIKAIRSFTSLPIEAHLMIVEPEHYLDEFAEAGADYIIPHVETSPHLHRTVQAIRALGKRPGVALNPSTPLAAIEEMLEYLEMVIVMTVNPGFGGQEFIHSMLPKITRLRRLLDERGSGCDIEVDGGINPDTAPLAVEAGANLLVAGSAVYGTPDGVRAAVARLQRSVGG